MVKQSVKRGLAAAYREWERGGAQGDIGGTRDRHTWTYLVTSNSQQADRVYNMLNFLDSLLNRSNRFSAVDRRPIPKRVTRRRFGGRF